MSIFNVCLQDLQDRFVLKLDCWPTVGVKEESLNWDLQDLPDPGLQKIYCK